MEAEGGWLTDTRNRARKTSGTKGKPNVANYWFEFGLKRSFCGVNNSTTRRKSLVTQHTLKSHKID